jgi:hypothetical protein
VQYLFPTQDRITSTGKNRWKIYSGLEELGDFSTKIEVHYYDAGTEKSFVGRLHGSPFTLTGHLAPNFHLASLKMTRSAKSEIPFSSTITWKVKDNPFQSIHTVRKCCRALMLNGLERGSSGHTESGSKQN